MTSRISDISRKDKQNITEGYERIRLLIDFEAVVYFIALYADNDDRYHGLGHECAYELLESIMMFRFTPTDSTEESKYELAHWWNGIEGGLKVFYKDEEKQEKIRSLIDKCITFEIQKYIPNYNQDKETDKAFLGVRRENEDALYSLYIECRILR